MRFNFFSVAFFSSTVVGFTNNMTTMNRTRREILSGLATCFAGTTARGRVGIGVANRSMNPKNTVRLGFVGDVMIGRAIDSILPFSVDGSIHESYMKDASGYVRLAENENGPLPHKIVKEKGSSYIWGDLIHDLQSPDALIINLETTLTTSNDWDRSKGIHYRSHPGNVESLSAIGVSVATLANNHVLDWGEEGLKETIRTLDAAGINHAGAGFDIEGAKKPTFVSIKQLYGAGMEGDNQCQEKELTIGVLAIGFPSAGVPMKWGADKSRCGVNVEYEANEQVAEKAFDIIQKYTEAELETSSKDGAPDIKIVSLHWGSNWGWGTPIEWRLFAHKLINLGVDVVIGHSSHHVKGIEVYKNKLIAYGLGDFLNDYEGIVGQGYEEYRNDLSALYLPVIDLESKELIQVDIIPCKIKHLKVQRATDPADIAWLQSAINSEGKALGTTCVIDETSGALRLEWRNGV